MRGSARITEENVQDMLREVRMALLEADVALPVVRDFIARVKDRALGAEVIGSLSPGPGAGRRRRPRAGGDDGRRRRRHRPRGAAAGGHPDGRPAGRRQDDDHRQARQAPDREAQEEGADGLGRRLPAGGDRAAEDGDAPGRRRMVPVERERRAGGDRARRARPRAQPLLRRAAGRHRRPPGDRREADGRDPRAARGAATRSRRCSSSTRCRARTRSTPPRPSRKRCR